MCRTLSFQEYRENFLKKANNLTHSQRSTVTGTEIFRMDFLYPNCVHTRNQAFPMSESESFEGGKKLLLT